MPRRQEQGGACAHVGRDQVGRAQLELGDEPVEELAHGAGGQHFGASLRVAEAGQVDRDQPPCPRQGWPDARSSAEWLGMPQAHTASYCASRAAQSVT